MPINVRAALALSLPIGLIVLSAGGAIVGWQSDSTLPPATPRLSSLRSEPAASAKRTLDPNDSSSPLTESIGIEKPADQNPASYSFHTREPYEPATWPRQYALDDPQPAEGPVGPDVLAPNDWQALPIQYVAEDATRQVSAAQPQATAPAQPAAPTPLPRAVEPRTEPRPPAALDLAALAPVSQQAQLRVDEAFRYARRGALYAARAELIQALRMIAQAVDTLERDNRRSQALAAGFHAMKEAEDFYVRSDTLEHDLDVEGIVLAHRTPVLKGKPLDGVSSLAALQHYYAFAQQQFAIAAAGTPAGSRALYGLGKVHMTLARDSSDDRSHQTPKAMAFFQASMQADDRNYLAANELGVLLAQFGQLAEARRVLVHSVSMQSHPEGWQNLAVVHSRLGEHDLARKATYERELLIAQSAGKPRSDQPVTWVGPREFNSVGGPDAMAAAPAYRPAQPGNTTRR